MPNENEGIQKEDEATELHSEEAKDSTDWKAEARKWEDRAKANRKAAEQAEEALKAHADYDVIKAELEAMKADKARADAVANAAVKHGVDADLLSRMAGDVEENAQYLAGLPRYAAVHDGGERTAPKPKKTTAELFADALNSK